MGRHRPSPPRPARHAAEHRMYTCPCCGQAAEAGRLIGYPVQVRIRRFGGYRSAVWIELEPTKEDIEVLREALARGLEAVEDCGL